ncbi:MAG TPA: large-conductance mechanosensitive channel protein MscL [Oligoflexia bacterium]|nr:large-conductance mechanosensitive channel protein MscL [Oligoflexia bacterium]HMP49037.1 large-conductance mechanosensitive channel protein MscL [Oligoflexia bacterium]
MGFVKEFKEFAVKGNVMDMAVGIIIGGAFGKIVTSLVGDVIMPAVGILAGGIDFTGLAVTLSDVTGSQTVTLAYGKFLQTVFDFIIVAISIFIVIKMINSLRKKGEEEQKEEAPAEPSAQEQLLTEIRDILRVK